MPLPSAETTPPVTKMKRVSGRRCRASSLWAVRVYRDGRRSVSPALTRRPAAPRRACGRASSDASAPSIRQSSSTTPSPSSASTVVSAGSSSERTSRSGSGRSASAAIWGRWVMQSTWRRSPERAQPLADGARRLAAHAGVHLVEHERARLARAGHGHQGEHHARQLAARRGLAQRRRRHARVRREHELDPLGAARRRSRRAARALTSNDASLHRERRQLLAHPLRQPRRRLAPRVGRARPPARSRSAARLRQLGLGPLGRHLGLLAAARARRGSARRARAPPPRCRRACARAGRTARAAPRPPASRPGSASSESA